MSKLLINENPLQVLPTLAEAIGLNNAIVLQQVHYWLENSKKGKNTQKYKHGRYWVYNSYPEWQKTNFPFWSAATIKRIFLSLEEEGYLVSGQFEGNKRRKWYTIDYSKLELGIPSGQNDLMELEQVKMSRSIGSKLSIPSGQNDPMLNKELTETTTEITTDINNTPQDGAAKPPKKERDERLDNPAIIAYREMARLHAPIIYRDDIIAVVGNDVDRWREHVKKWIGLGWKKTNIEGMLDTFKNGFKTKQQLSKSNGNRVVTQAEADARAKERKDNQDRIRKEMDALRQKI